MYFVWFEADFLVGVRLSSKSPTLGLPTAAWEANLSCGAETSAAEAGQMDSRHACSFTHPGVALEAGVTRLGWNRTPSLGDFGRRGQV